MVKNAIYCRSFLYSLRDLSHEQTFIFNNLQGFPERTLADFLNCEHCKNTLKRLAPIKSPFLIVRKAILALGACVWQDKPSAQKVQFESKWSHLIADSQFCVNSWWSSGYWLWYRLPPTLFTLPTLITNHFYAHQMTRIGSVINGCKLRSQCIFTYCAFLWRNRLGFM